MVAVFVDGRLQTFLESAARFHRERDQVHSERQSNANSREPLLSPVATDFGVINPYSKRDADRLAPTPSSSNHQAITPANNTPPSRTASIHLTATEFLRLPRQLFSARDQAHAQRLSASRCSSRPRKVADFIDYRFEPAVDLLPVATRRDAAARKDASRRADCGDRSRSVQNLPAEPADGQQRRAADATTSPFA